MYKRVETMEEAAESINNYMRRAKRTVDQQFEEVSPNCEYRYKDTRCIRGYVQRYTMKKCSLKNCPYLESW